jgi:hypothetical protein
MKYLTTVIGKLFCVLKYNSLAPELQYPYYTVWKLLMEFSNFKTNDICRKR